MYYISTKYIYRFIQVVNDCFNFRFMKHFLLYSTGLNFVLLMELQYNLTTILFLYSDTRISGRYGTKKTLMATGWYSYLLSCLYTLFENFYNNRKITKQKKNSVLKVSFCFIK